MSRVGYAVFVVAVVLCNAAGAADVTFPVAATTSQIWFGNALQAVLMTAAAPIAAILCALLWKIAAKMGIQASAADQEKLNAEAKAALTVGAVKASELIASRGWDHANVHSAVLADALNYFLERFPDRATAVAAAAGVQNPSEPSVAKENAVTETLMARLPDAMNEAAASPATPPAGTVTIVAEAASGAPPKGKK